MTSAQAAEAEIRSLAGEAVSALRLLSESSGRLTRTVQALLKAEDAIALAVELILCARAPHKSREATNYTNQNPRIRPQTYRGVFVLKRVANSDSGT